MYKWLFHIDANFIEKLKLIRKLYEPTLKIHTDETKIRQKQRKNRANKSIEMSHIFLHTEGQIIEEKLQKKFQKVDFFLGSLELIAIFALAK